VATWAVEAMEAEAEGREALVATEEGAMGLVGMVGMDSVGVREEADLEKARADLERAGVLARAAEVTGLAAGVG